ncbi:helix-turn-helix domain-containing protein [Methylobacillus arboreus]|uniref:helix-turn-helix transcriptional regulator n=1 Tax=Methylobacillus arboreus TaxID=755170 RepID=UPI001E30327B|nr:helix-turn-helix transcriptional regulator [Methylobacillus arboreus]MCB5190663.1 helix-turn-helix domain-containing protein [Methylobacillus arboreus]
MINMLEIGSKIRRRRIKSGLSQAELAARSGVSRATINALEKGTIKEIGFNRLSAIIRTTDALQPKAKEPSLKVSESKSEKLALSFPYDWSNPSLPDELLIDRVLERGIYEDIARITAEYGIDAISDRAKTVISNIPHAAANINRMLDNLHAALSHA